MKKKIYLSNYCHADHVWTNTRPWHISRYLRSINTALDVIKEHPTFVYVMDNYCHFLEPFMENFPERIDELKSALKNGNFVFLNGGYSLPRPTRRGEEEFVRNIVKGKRVLEDISGVPVKTFFNADTACGHSQLPQLLKLSGHENYIFWRPEALLNEKKIPKRFYWKGLSGDEISACRVIYSSYFGDEYLGENYNFERAKEGFEKEIESRSYLLDGDKILMFEGIDDCIPCMGALDTPSPMFDFIKEYNEKTKNEVQYASPDEYFSDSNKDIPTFEGVVEQCDVAFNVPTKKPVHSLYRKRLEIINSLLKVERLSAICEKFAGFGTDSQIIEKWWDCVFLVSGHAEDGAIDKELEYLLNRANQGIYEIEEELLRLKAEFAKMVKGNDKDYIVFNFSGAKRRTNVEVHIADYNGIHDFIIKDSKGNLLEYQITRLYKNDKPYKSFFYSAADVLVDLELPALGYEKICVEFSNEALNLSMPLSYVYGGAYGEKVETPIEVDNGLFKVTFNANGIESIKDYQGNSFKGEMGSVIFERTETPAGWWSNKPTLETLSQKNFECRVLANGDLRSRFKILGKVGEHSISQIVTIEKNDPIIHFNTIINCVDDCGRFWVKFNSDKNMPLKVGVPFGEEIRDLSIENYITTDAECSIVGLFNYGDYIKAANNGKEFCIFNVDLCTNAKQTDDGIFIFLRRMMGDSFIDNSNVGAWYNQGDRYIKATGTMDYEYGLAPFGVVNSAAVIAKDLLIKPDFVKKYNVAGNLPENNSLLEIKNENVAVSSFRKNENGYELRVFETDGKESDLSITSDFSKVIPIDLNGNPIKDDVDKICSYQIKTLLFK